MTEQLSRQDESRVDSLLESEAPSAQEASPAPPQIARVSSYRLVRALVAVVVLFALTVITLVLGVMGPNRFILLSLAAGGMAGLVFGAVAMQILQPTAPPGARSESQDGPSPWEQFLRELDRSRRYDLTFTLARIPRPSAPEAERLGRPGRGRRARRDRMADLGGALRPHLRSTDLTWNEGAYLYALLPGIDHDVCRRLLDRIDAHSPGLIPSSGVAFASFPADGLTGNALLAALDRAPQPSQGSDA